MGEHHFTESKFLPIFSSETSVMPYSAGNLSYDERLAKKWISDRRFHVNDMGGWPKVHSKAYNLGSGKLIKFHLSRENTQIVFVGIDKMCMTRFPLLRSYFQSLTLNPISISSSKF